MRDACRRNKELVERDGGLRAPTPAASFALDRCAEDHRRDRPGDSSRLGLGASRPLMTIAQPAHARPRATPIGLGAVPTARRDGHRRRGSCRHHPGRIGDTPVTRGANAPTRVRRTSGSAAPGHVVPSRARRDPSRVRRDEPARSICRFRGGSVTPRGPARCRVPQRSRPLP